MTSPVNHPISNFELLGRSLYYPSNIGGNNKFRKGIFYPYNKEDKERPGLYTNKISIVRICKDQRTDGMPQWNNQINTALSFKDIINKDGSIIERTFKGFLVAPFYMFAAAGLSCEPAASNGNPFHAHLVIPGYSVKYDRENKRKISDVLPNEWRARLDRLERECSFIEFENEKIVSSEWADICTQCNKAKNP